MLSASVKRDVVVVLLNSYEDDDHRPAHDRVEDAEPVREQRMLRVGIHPEK